MSARGAGAAVEEWRPRLFDASAEKDAIARFTAEAAFVHDTLAAQLAELCETRLPARRLTPAELDAEVARHLDGRALESYGVWAWFGWSRRLVHLLPEAEFRELRTSRNRNKITDAEQVKLRRLKLGVAGLSVGQATALTLALEEIGGEFRLADFDTLSLSNLNRLRAGVHDLGVNKAVLTARAILEINPFVDVALFPDGVRDHNLDEFLSGLDLLFEECDDLAMKVRLRERARSLGVPVLMETSDRGLFDVERFDREKNRPLFHGLAGDLDARSLGALTVAEKVPVVLKILGAKTMSPRLSASMVDVEATVKTWPQLASSVALGGAINTDAARRIALGQFSSSGRYFVDLESIVADGADYKTPPPEFDATAQNHDAGASQNDAAAQNAAASAPDDEPAPAPLVRVAGPLGRDTIAGLVARAAAAPSGGNCQPWRFVARGDTLLAHHEAARSRSFLDFGHAASYVAFGAAVENLALAASELGRALAVEEFPDADDATLIFRARVHGDAPLDPLARAILPRATNRRLGAPTALAEADAAALAEVAAAAGARLQLATRRDQLDELGAILGAGDRARFLSSVMHREMMAELRWTDRAARATRDGLDLATLELSPADRAGLELLASPAIMDTLRATGGGAGLEKPARKAIAASSAVALLSAPGTSAHSYLRGGRALERVWLTATARDLAIQPMTALLYLFTRLDQGGEGLSQSDIKTLENLRKRYQRIFEMPAGNSAVLLFRIAHAAPPSARSLRRKTADILQFV